VKSQWINTLQPGMEVSTYFGIFDVNLGKTKNGAKFLKILIGDRTGTAEARVWDPTMADDIYHLVTPGDIVIVQGMATEFNGLQVNIDRCHKADKSQIDLNDFRPVTDQNIPGMLEKFTGKLARVADPHLQDLIRLIFTPQMLKDFSLATAARTIHHAYGGGLLEHTLEVMEYCEKILALQGAYMDTGILITGAALHDIGKLWEYDQGGLTFQVTAVGKMLGGHVILGHDFLRDRLQELPGFPSQTALHMEHLILSHHGQKEWGAVEEPRTLEAIALHHADLLSARMNQAAQLVKTHQGGDAWTNYDKHLGRSIMVPSVNKKPKNV
jgi:3'-5' exoribonuclease